MKRKTSLEQAVYAPISNATSVGLRDFEPEQFKCWPGSVLVVVPDKEKITQGGIILVDEAQEDQTWGIVAAVPEESCRIKPGDRVFFRPGAGESMLFKDRKDLKVLKYEEGVGSDIQGWIPAENFT